MASIRKRGNSYLIIVSMGYDYKGKRIKPVQKTVHPPLELTPKQTEKWLEEQALLFEMEVKHAPRSIDRSITLAKYIEIWLRDVAPTKLAASTLARERQDIAHILPALGHVKLRELTPELLRDFYDKMRKQPCQRGRPYSERTIEGLHACVCGILTDAVGAGYLTHNPAWRAYKYKGKNKDVVIADEEILQKLIAALEQESIKYEVYYKLIILTGMRRGECGALRWEDIDYKEASIHIRRNVIKLSHEPAIIKDPKTAAGDRVVYISAEMISLLKEYRQWQESATGTAANSGYLFPQPNGTPMHPSTFTSKFKQILEKYDLPRQLSVHSLRHTNASLLISQNVDVRTVAALLGHAQPSTTLDIYSHAFDKTKKEAQVKLMAVLDM